MSRKSLAALQLSPLIIFPTLAVLVYNDLIILSGYFGENFWLAPKLEKFINNSAMKEIFAANNKLWNAILISYSSIILFILFNYIIKLKIYIYQKKYTIILSVIYIIYTLFFLIDDVDNSALRSYPESFYIKMGVNKYIYGQIGIYMLASAAAGVMITIFSVLAEPKLTKKNKGGGNG